MSELVTIGEALALLTTPEVGRVRDMTSLRLGVGGAESNVAIGVRRLGHTASWIGRVGNDEFGKMIIEMLRREDVDVSSVRFDDAAQTAIMLKERRTADVVRVSYYRQGYAGSSLCPADVDEGLVTGARILHVTGITLGLSPSARQVVYRAAELAAAHGVLVSFDLNYRAALWDHKEAAREFAEMAALADVIFAGEEELALLGAEPDPLVIARRLVAGRTEQVVIKRGSGGATTVTGEETWTEPAIPVRAIDPVGAGDAFVAGYLAAELEGLDVAACLRQGCACGAFAVSVVGDWEGLPSLEDLSLLDHASGTTLR
jgi:2-dehydro-3-deoxygluconokinase